MTWRIKNRRAAKKATRAAQAAGVLLLVSGVAMGAFGQLVLQVDEPAAPPRPAPIEEQPDQGATPTGRAFDPIAVNDNLSMILNKPLPDPIPTAAGPDEGEPPPTEAPSREIRYVGSVQVGEKAAAFMSISGATKLLRVGQTFEGVRLVAVESGEVTISVDGGDEQTVEKAERHGSAVSVLVGGAPEPTPETPVVAGDQPVQPPNFTPNMSREDRRAALIEQARQGRARWDRQRGEGGPPDRNQR
ncbi:MAG: hypothetical protein IPJ41_04135 [Phycisphaerales bacterium]|nr:hypothetical protein [Phycisphaerales bacterium]